MACQGSNTKHQGKGRWVRHGGYNNVVSAYVFTNVSLVWPVCVLCFCFCLNLVGGCLILSSSSLSLSLSLCQTHITSAPKPVAPASPCRLQEVGRVSLIVARVAFSKATLSNTRTHTSSPLLRRAPTIQSVWCVPRHWLISTACIFCVACFIGEEGGIRGPTNYGR